MPVEVTAVYVGPNVLLPAAAFRVVYHPPVACEWRSTAAAATVLGALCRRLAGLEAALAASHPMAEVLVAGGTGGLPLAVVVMHAAMALQRRSGHPGGACRWLSGSDAQVFVCAYRQEVIARHAVHCADALVAAAVTGPGREADLDAALVEYLRVHDANVARDALGPVTLRVVQAAEARGLPWRRLDGALPAVEIGQGRHACRMRGSLLDTEGLLAGGFIAGDALALGSLLREAGCPVPEAWTARHVADVVRAANGFGYPVSLRRLPADEGHPSVKVADEFRLTRAAMELLAGGATVVVEKVPAGAPVRVLVIDGHAAAAASSAADGALRDITDELPPCVSRLAERAVASVRVRVAEVGLMVDEPFDAAATVSAVTTLRPAPDLAPWVAAMPDRAGVFAQALLEALLPATAPAHLPVAVVTGTNGKTTTTLMTMRMLREAGAGIGWCSTLGAGVDDERLLAGDQAGVRGFRLVAADARVSAIVAEVARGGLLQHGMACASAEVGVVTNVTTDHLGEYGIETVEEMAAVKRVVAHAVTGTLVLNADDPLCLAMAEGARARRLCLVSLDEHQPALRQHRERHGVAAVLALRGGREVLLFCDGEREREILPAASMPAALGGHARHNLQNALFACGLAEGLGVELPAIARALAAFSTDREHLPGRLNRFPGLPFEVILDYGHNPGAYRCIGPMVTGLAADRGRRLCVFTSPGDRDESFLREMAAAAAPHFDLFICRESQRVKPGAPAVSPRLRAALLANGVPAAAVHAGLASHDAVRLALTLAAPGDVIYLMTPPDTDGGFWQLLEEHAARLRLDAGEV